MLFKFEITKRFYNNKYSDLNARTATTCIKNLLICSNLTNTQMEKKQISYEVQLNVHLSIYLTIRCCSYDTKQCPEWCSSFSANEESSTHTANFNNFWTNT